MASSGRTKQINIRLSEGEIALLNKLAAGYGASIGRPVGISVYIRYVLFNADPDE